MYKGFPSGTSGEESTCQCRRHKGCRLDPWVSKIPWRKKWQPTPVFLPGEPMERSLAGYRLWGHKESDVTEQGHTHTRTQCINEKPLNNHDIHYSINYSYLLFWGFQNNCRRRQWHPTPVLLPGKSHGWRSLVGLQFMESPELDTTEQLHFHFSLSCIGEGNGNPLQCSCLENPRDGKPGWLPSMGSHRVRHD